MKDYDLTLVMDPDASGEDRKKQIEKTKKAITELKGKVEKVDEWGRKELAYPVKKKNSGYYFLLAVKLPEEGPMEIEKKLRMDENIIRYLLVKKE